MVYAKDIFFIQECQKMQYNGHSNVDGTMLTK